MPPNHFAQKLKAGVEPHTPGEKGAADQKLIEAIYQAAAGGSTVKLPLLTGRDTTRGPQPQDQS